eukprot:TRINITY_DN48351_c0_g1_i1.p1 TRINITY_DN48351_c0_g1~~TRINITY_DN48351_c0_g1_i1.p1  ORF type:complete len:224 (+),score=36.53 TRINITY_DN48351_c0_g1_i1:49-720(+)
MSYNGYAEGNKTVDGRTPLEQALRALPSDKAPETLELIEKLTRNVLANPTDDKFRRIKLTNPKIAASITNVRFAVDALREMGWLQLPDGLSLPMSITPSVELEITAIIVAKDYYKNEALNPDNKPTSNEYVECTGEGVFEYKDYDGEHVRLVKHLEDEAHIEVFVEGKSFWKGIPEFNYETGRLLCGEKGASVLPEASRESLRTYLASMPAPVKPVLRLNVDG